MENVLKRNLGTDRTRECIFTVQILKVSLLAANHGGTFMCALCVLVYPPNPQNLDTSLFPLSQQHFLKKRNLASPISMVFSRFCCCHRNHFFQLYQQNKSSECKVLQTSQKCSKVFLKVFFCFSISFCSNFSLESTVKTDKNRGI